VRTDGTRYTFSISHEVDANDFLTPPLPYAPTTRDDVLTQCIRGIDKGYLIMLERVCPWGGRGGLGSSRDGLGGGGSEGGETEGESRGVVW